MLKIQRRTLLLGSALGAATTLLAACGGGDDPVTLDNIVEIAQANPNFSTLVEAVVKAELAGALSGTDQLTVFAPTNAAFDAAAVALGLANGPALVAALSSEALESILTYHVVAGRNLSTSLSTSNLPTLYSFGGSASALALTVSGSAVSIRDAVLTTSNVTQANIEASNGVLHVIDKVLVPPGVLNIVQMAQLNPSFSSLVSAVASASLVSALSDAEATLTVFAPVNDAFAAISSTVASLSPEELTTVLTYHVLGSQVLSSGIPFGTPVNTLASQFITINDNATPPAIATIADTTMTAANIVAVDVRASNGVIHVIDKVLLPELAPA